MATRTVTVGVEALTSEPLAGDELEQLAPWRAALAAELAAPPGPALTEPLQAASVLFAHRFSAQTVRRVERLLAQTRRMAPVPGRPAEWLYAYHDARDADSLLKVGGTHLAEPRERVAQHAAALDAPRGAVTMLFAFPVRRFGPAERLVHELLAPFRPAAVLVAASSGHRKTEYFVIDDWRALGALLKAVTRYVNALLAS